MPPRFANAGLLLARLLCVIAFAAVLYAGLRSAPVPNVLLQDEDKLHHIAGFFVLAVLLALSFPGGNRLRQGASLIALGLAIEAMQAAMPARTFSTLDVLANAVGVIAGMLVVARLRPARRGATVTR